MGAPRTFGEYVMMEQERQGVSLRQLAKQLGKHAATISRVEDGRIAIPTPDYFMDLVEALNLDIVTAVNLLKPYRRIYDSILNATQKGGNNE
jgi:transcriptional regulator with XRE-family HTH domain